MTSSVKFNLGNYTRGLSSTSSQRSTGSNGKNVKNTKLEPLKSQRSNPQESIQILSASAKNHKTASEGTSLEKTFGQRELNNAETQGKHGMKSFADLKKTFVDSGYVPIDNEAEYYEIVRRLDVCGHCWAANQKYCNHPFKLMQKNPIQTLYQKDYVKHPLEGKGPKVKNDFYGTFHIDEPMDLTTTMRKDYQPHNIGAPKRYTMENKSSASGVPFAGRSGYKADYINWGNLPVTIERPPNNVTVISELPFSSKTAYGDNFIKHNPTDQAKPVDRDLWKTKRSPLSPGIPFSNKTSYNQTYKPHELGNVPSFPIIDDFQPDEAYPGQYNTIYKEDYTKPDKWKCPARIFIETHPHPKEKTLML